MIKKEVITIRQGIAMVALFTAGNSMLLLPGRAAKQDVWIAILLAIMAGLAICYLYSKILSFYPGKDLFGILDEVFGKIPGKIITIFFIWHALFLAALVFRSFWEFIREVGLPQTPPAVVILCMISLCAWGCKEGIEVLGRWAELFVKFLIAITCFALILSISSVNPKNLLPIFHSQIPVFLSSSLEAFTFPFAEIVIFLMVFSDFREKNPYYKTLAYGMLIGGALILLISMRNVAMLGAETNTRSNFPEYMALGRIRIGDFIQRLEIAVSVTFLLNGFIKVSICLLAASNGIAKLFNSDDYRFIVIPTAILIANLSYMAYKNEIEMNSWPQEVWPYYALIYQVIWPVVIFTAEIIKLRRKASVGNS